MRTHSTHSSVECGPRGFVDITDVVRAELEMATFSSGRATVFTRTADCTVFLNENESGLRLDVVKAIARIRKPGASVAGAGSSSVIVPIVDGQLWMGDWQRILAFALDEARGPELVVQITGE